MDNLKVYLAPLGRLLMSSLFLWAGIHKLTKPGGTSQYFAAVHIPAPDVAVWVVIAIEVIGGLAILLGFKARWAAAVLAIFSLVTAFGVHLPVGDLANMTNFYKNLVMAGGFLYIVAYGAGGMSIDGEKA
jgi:putative oxidoreductase